MITFFQMTLTCTFSTCKTNLIFDSNRDLYTYFKTKTIALCFHKKITIDSFQILPNRKQSIIFKYYFTLFALRADD